MNFGKGIDRERLNLGSGKDFRPDCWNVDVNEKFKPDLVMDMLKLKCDKDIFIEVIMRDVLDHITPTDARVLLRRIKGWMKAGGLLHIHTPNLEYLAEILFKSEDDTLRHMALKWLYSTDGKGTTNYESNKICWSYNKKSLKQLLEDLGFKVLKDWVDCSGFGLNMVAQK